MCFILNPFEGDINTATPKGSKLFMKETERSKEEKKIEILQEKFKAIMNLLGTLASQFGWGSLINLVSVYTPNGLENKSILHHRKAIYLRDVQAQAWEYFSNSTVNYLNFNERFPLKMWSIDPVHLVSQRKLSTNMSKLRS